MVSVPMEQSHRELRGLPYLGQLATPINPWCSRWAVLQPLHGLTTSQARYSEFVTALVVNQAKIFLSYSFHTLVPLVLPRMTENASQPFITCQLFHT